MNNQLINKFSNDLQKYEANVLSALLQQHGMKPAQFAQIIITELKQSAKMQAAFRQNPSSLFASILHCAELGLSPSRMSGEFYFSADNGIVKPIIGYRGLCTLMLRNKNVSAIYCETVHEGDEFEYELGMNPKLIHKPTDPIRNSETLTHVYAVAKMRYGESPFKVLTKAEILSVVALIPGAGDWYFNDAKDPLLWLPRKTGIKQLSKLVPKDYFCSYAVGVDDRIEGGEHIILDETNKIIFNAQKVTIKKQGLYTTLGNIEVNDLSLHSQEEGTS